MKLALFALLLTCSVYAQDKFTTVVIKTTMGEIQVDLNETKAPKTVANFLEYVDADFYSGTIFHRVINGFMIQGGGLTADMTEKPTRAPIPNEAANGLSNEVGTIAMARTGEPHSATAQFFINVENNSRLDYTAPTVDGYGYCVFGKVTKGMDIVNRIKMAKTGSIRGYTDVPMDTISIKSITRLNGTAAPVTPAVPVKATPKAKKAKK